MYLLTNRSTAILLKYPSLSLLLRTSRSHALPPTSFTYSVVRDFSSCYRLGKQKSILHTSGALRKLKSSVHVFDDRDLAHISWWRERLETCRKPSTIHLVKLLVYCNLLGLNTDLKNGNLKEGTLNWEILQFKSKFPREVLLCRVGDFYEAIGIDACILVEYAGLNPFGGLRTDSIPRAGCPVVNLRQTLDDLTSYGYSVCIVEELQGPAQARTRKSRFVSGHAHPGSPYVFGLVGDDRDVDFPEPMPVAGISRSARGYCLIKVLETMKTYATEDGLTEEALVTKLRTCRFHHLFLHTSVRSDCSATSRWGEYGQGGLLWGECNGKHYEWFEGDAVTEILSKVKELYGIGMDEDVEFRNVTVSAEHRPHPLHLGTATQIGAIPSEGIPSLLKVLLPSHCLGLPVLYIRDLLLNPPTYEVASSILEICRLVNNVNCSVPDFTCIPTAKVVKLLETREANHIEFSRIKNVVDEVLFMHNNVELKEILRLLMDPTWLATGLKIDVETLTSECKTASEKISEMIHLGDESNQKISSFPNVPREFFEDMESSWKGRVKRIHIEDHFVEVDEAAHALSVAVSEDFAPIITRIKATTAPFGGPKGEILYAKEHESVWFKGKRFTPTVWGNTLGEAQIKQLKPALDSKGRKVGEEWFTSFKVEAALTRYHEANEKARSRFLELLRQLSANLQPSVNILVFSSMLLVVSKALFSHVSEGRRRKWVFPSLTRDSNEMKLTGLFPYWFDPTVGSAVHNTVDMQSLFLLTGPNGGGKSSLLRSVCAASLLGICGLMVPAHSSLIPHFDAIMLHMKSYDSPVDGKSSFQVEMSELRSLISSTSSSSLVLIDEICRGTETAKGTCIAGSIIEALDQTGCLGIVSTHLHGIFDLPLKTQKVVYKAMESVYSDGRTKPTWRLVDGICRESLAFETAKREGLSDVIIERAQRLYMSYTMSPPVPVKPRLDFYRERPVPDYGILVTLLCQRKVVEMYVQKYVAELFVVNFVEVDTGAKPPPSAVGCSCLYVMTRPDKKLYVGVTDDMEGRIRAHRAKEGMQDASFMFMKVAGKSLACLLETYLINQLPLEGFNLSNISDGKHRNFGSTNGLAVL